MANFITLDQLKKAVQSLLIKINDRFDSIVIPSKVSDLDNDSGFITNSSIPTNVSDLTNDAEYQNASQVSSAISSAVANINSFNVSIVQTLPTTNIDTHTIYFISNSGSGTDVYDEYMYINNAWQKIGNTAVDLSGYVPTSRTINNKALTSNISLTASDVGAATSNHTHSSIQYSSGSVNTSISVSASTATFSFTSVSGSDNIQTNSLTMKHVSGGVTINNLISGTTDTSAINKKYVDDAIATVPSWAMQSTKPTYTANQVGAMSTSHAANVITAQDITNWNNKPSTDTNTTYTISMSSNRITLTPSSGTATYVDLPVYDSTVTDVWTGGNY